MSLDDRRVDLVIDQGADFAIQIYWTDPASNPIPVVAPIRMDIKSTTGVVLHSLITNADEEDESNVLYNTESGLIQLTIDAEHTAAMPAGEHRYDLFVTYQDNRITNSTRLQRLIWGTVYVTARVTTNV